MKARLFVRGMKEPVELELPEAEAAQKLIVSGASPDTPFSIQGVWSGKKADMKFVVFDKPERSRYAEDLTPMDTMDAKMFDNEVDVYRKEAEAAGLIPAQWDLFYLQKMGAVKVGIFDSPVAGDSTKRFNYSICSVSLYAELSKKLERFRLWEGRQAYAEQRRLESYDELAKQMRI